MGYVVLAFFVVIEYNNLKHFYVQPELLLMEYTHTHTRLYTDTK